MRSFPVGNVDVAAALAALPLSIRGTRAAEYVYRMRAADWLDKVDRAGAQRCRADAAALLLAPVALICGECGAAISAGEEAMVHRNATLGIDWHICRGCRDEAADLQAEHA